MVVVEGELERVTVEAVGGGERIHQALCWPRPGGHERRDRDKGQHIPFGGLAAARLGR